MREARPRAPARARGSSLVELMVSLTLASLLGLAVAEVYARQARTHLVQVQRSFAVEDAEAALHAALDLVRQAEGGSVSVVSGPGSASVRLTLPAGVPIWPNDTPPYTDNEVLLFWSADAA